MTEKPDDIISRLQAERAIKEHEGYDGGLRAGDAWARAQATPAATGNLMLFRQSCGPEWESLFIDDESPSGHAMDPIARAILQLPQNQTGQSDLDLIAEFWENAVRPGVRYATDPAFVHGFVVAAILVHQEIWKGTQ